MHNVPLLLPGCPTAPPSSLTLVWPILVNAWPWLQSNHARPPTTGGEGTKRNIKKIFLINKIRAESLLRLISLHIEIERCLPAPLKFNVRICGSKFSNVAGYITKLSLVRWLATEKLGPSTLLARVIWSLLILTIPVLTSLLLCARHIRYTDEVTRQMCPL